MLAQLPPAQRITLCQGLTPSADGDSLANKNVNDYPEGAIFFVVRNASFYQLKKNLPSAVVETNTNNVINGVGSSDAAGRFVALQQTAAATLTGGTVVIAGFDFSNAAGTFNAGNWYFQVTQILPGGTPGVLRAAATAVNTVTVTSASGSDTSSVIVLAIPSKSL